jgi:hypothetical protein
VILNHTHFTRGARDIVGRLSTDKNIMVARGLHLVSFMVASAAAFQPAHLQQRMRASRTPMMNARKGGILGAVDDILDYLTNMGGYTGFTEDELKGGKSLNERDMSEFGKPTEDLDENITTAFVVLLILFPSVLGLIAVKIFGTPAFFTYAAKDAGT